MTREQAEARWWESVERDRIHAAAAEWITQLQDPDVSYETALAWQQWMSADTRHAEAFRRLEEVREQMSALRPPPLPAFARSAIREARTDRYDGSVPLGEWIEQRRRAYSGWRPLVLAASIACIAVALASTFVMRSPSAWDSLFSSGVVMQTAIGENRSVRLEDGSHVTLGGGTALVVAYGESERRVALTRGEAFFDVARDESRPFLVRAGDATVTAVGTQFNVRRAQERVVVAVVEGRVRVEPTPHPLAPAQWLLRLKGNTDNESVQVDAGHQTTVGESGVGAAVSLPDPATVLAWRSGRLAFEREPLRYVLEDVNRYSAKPIVTADPAIGELLITGTVLDDSVSGWITSLESAFGLRALDEPDRIVLTRAAAEP